MGHTTSTHLPLLPVQPQLLTQQSLPPRPSTLQPQQQLASPQVTLGSLQATTPLITPQLTLPLPPGNTMGTRPPPLAVLPSPYQTFITSNVFPPRAGGSVNVPQPAAVAAQPLAFSTLNVGGVGGVTSILQRPATNLSQPVLVHQQQLVTPHGQRVLSSPLPSTLPIRVGRPEITLPPAKRHAMEAAYRSTPVLPQHATHHATRQVLGGRAGVGVGFPLPPPQPGPAYTNYAQQLGTSSAHMYSAPGLTTIPPPPGLPPQLRPPTLALAPQSSIQGSTGFTRRTGIAPASWQQQK